MADLTVFPVETSSDQAPHKVIATEVVSAEYLERVYEVGQNALNDSGRALTSISRFLLIAPSALFVLVAELLVFADKQIVRNFPKKGVRL
jgi:hypothetical protein